MIDEISKPFYKGWWFIIITPLLLLGVILGSAEDKNKIVESQGDIKIATTTVLTSELPETPVIASTASVSVVSEKTTPVQIDKKVYMEDSVVHRYYDVVSVVDGDTVKIKKDGEVITLRLIGIDTPEIVDPRRPVQCFGAEASQKAKEILTGRKVRLEFDESQGEFDKYNRTLAYVFLESGLSINRYLIEYGYAHEYTFNTPYKYQKEFKQAEVTAKSNKRGLWSPDVCSVMAESVLPTALPIKNNVVSESLSGVSQNSCEIKGNINSDREKIYHMVGCKSYTKTKIDVNGGERWFCSEQEALSAGWRKALNCD